VGLVSVAGIKGKFRQTVPAVPGRSRTPTSREPEASVTTRGWVSGPAMLSRSPDQIRSTQASGTIRYSCPVGAACSHVHATNGETNKRST
jgi:hypothetical protein